MRHPVDDLLLEALVATFFDDPLSVWLFADELDSSGTVGHLQSSNATNVPFCERLGFAIDASVPICGGPPMFPMTRQPA